MSSPRVVAVVASLVLLAAGCTRGDPEPDRSATPTGPASSSAAPTASAEPAMITVAGHQRVDALPQPLATATYSAPDEVDHERSSSRAELVQVRRAGDVLRVVVALADAEDGGVSGFAMGDVRHPSSGPLNGWELHDPTASTVAEPLRTATGCSCTESMISMTPRGGQRLFWADFPAPTAGAADLLLGGAFPPLTGIPVPAGDDDGQPLPDSDLLVWVDEAPPEQVGVGLSAPRVHPVTAVTDAAGGTSQRSEGGAQELGLPADVLFALDSADLGPSAATLLDDAAARLAQAAQDQVVTVAGHTDDQGGEAHNLDLSQRRAQTVADRVRPVLAAVGTDLVVEGRGEGEPLAPNTTEDGTAVEANRVLNRRVAFSWAGEPPPASGAAAPRAEAAAVPAAVPAPSPSPNGSLASAQVADRGGVRLDVLRLARTGDGRVELRVEAQASDAEGSAWSLQPSRLPVNTQRHATNESLVGVVLRDVASGTGYHALTADDYCLCTRSVGDNTVYAGVPYELWGWFPAPPEGVQALDVEAGSFGRLEGVPLEAAP